MATARLYVARPDGYWWSGSHRGPAYSSGSEDFVIGVTKPDATNTGYQPGTTFTQVTNDLTITTDNTTYTDTMFIGGKVYVQARNVTFSNCWFRGQQTANTITDPLVRCHWDAAQDVVFSRCTFGEDSQVGWPDAGILGRGFTATRCDISRCSDGIRNVNSDTASNLGDITVEGCYIHDLMYLSPRNDGPDNQTHNDCIQLTGGSNILVKGNTLHAYVDPNLGQAATPGVPLKSDTDPSGLTVTGDHDAWMTALIITPDHAKVSDVTIDRNWLYGGQFTVNIAAKTYGLDIPGVTVTGNRFGGDTRIGGYDFIVVTSIQSDVHASGNTFPDDSAVPMSNG